MVMAMEMEMDIDMDMDTEMELTLRTVSSAPVIPSDMVKKKMAPARSEIPF